ncbi:cytochrome b5 [Phaffia rhodozyma]|uniref:Cytochrome b5 n=1 Tax=Phaffia rhodozyma TaxID=264483 RepID=A0A0F7SGQ0_PHARH|nr:cytochrome b5 [Phaffia rhodozyma]
MSPPTVKQVIYLKTKWLIEDYSSYLINTYRSILRTWDTAPLDALGHLAKALLPVALVFVGYAVFNNNSSSTTTSATPAQPRLAPRPGSQASILQGKTIQAERERAAAEGKKETPSIAKTTSMMSAPAVSLNAPLSTPISPAELAKHDGNSPDGKIYVAIKGSVFDVSAKREMYGPGASYNVFAGKDGSKGLGMSSLKPEDAVSDYSGLGDKEMATLDQWYSFFEKRYNIVGKVAE